LHLSSTPKPLSLFYFSNKNLWPREEPIDMEEARYACSVVSKGER
jgi:hypothetical protein